jgi:transcriptional regulator with XRE-family HTH domain
MPHYKPLGEPKSEFGKQLRQWREERGIKQGELCSLASLHSSHVGLLELGYYHPNEVTARKLADALGLSFEDEVWPLVEHSKQNYVRRLAPYNDTDPTFPNKTYLPLNVTEWLEGKAKARKTSKSAIIASMVMPVYREERRAAKQVKRVF